MAKNKKSGNNFKIKFKLSIFYIFIFLIIVGTGLIVSSTTLFKIEDILVEGESRYGDNDIIKSSNIHNGENLFFVKIKKIQETIQYEFPYIGEVEIKKKIPNKVIICVEEKSPIVEIEYNEQYLLVNKNRKIVDITNKKVDNICLIRGINIENPEKGRNIKFKNEETEFLSEEIINTVKKHEIDKIDLIDISNPMHIYMDYDKRIKLELGSFENLDYKIKTASVILKDKLNDNDKGTLDLTLSCTDNKSYFNQIYDIIL